MTRSRWMTVWLLAAATGLLLGCSRGNDKDDDAPPAASSPASSPLALTPQEQQAAGVQVQAVTLADLPATVMLNGSLVLPQERIAAVAPRLPGRVLAAPVPLGATVKAGEVLATLESVELGEAQTAHRQAASEARVAEATLDRAQKLAADEVIAQKDLQRARADAERARAALRAAADKLRLFDVSPAPPEASRDAVYPLRSPLAGTVIDKRAVPGTLAGSEPLFTVADLSTLWLVADVYEKDLAHLQTGGNAIVSVEAYPQRQFAGRLTYIAPTMDTATRTIKARIEVPNPQGALKAGMLATARITSTATARALVLPAAATTLLDGKPAVFIASAGGFEPRTVETAPLADGRVEVRAGLKPGERIAVSGAYALKARLLKASLAKDD